MHILLLTQYFPPEIGASQARLEYYANYFHAQGHRVTVLTTFPNYPDGRVMEGYSNRLYAREQRNGIEIVRTWLWEDTGKSIKARMKWFLSFMVSSFWGGMRIDRPDVIVVENPPLFSGVSAVWLKYLRGVPVINHLSDLWVDAAIDFGFLKKVWQQKVARRLERYVLTASDGIVSVTDKVHEHALRFKDASKVRLLPNGVDTDLYVSRPPNPDLLSSISSRDAFVVIYAGTMGYQHGLDVIVDTAKLLCEQASDVRFLLVGGGSERARIQERCEELGLDNVFFLDPQPQEKLVDYLNLADVGLSTLKKADFTVGVRPVKMYSYMACALPVIASDIGESGRIVRDAACGFPVPPEDAVALRDAILQLRDDRSSLTIYGENGRKYVEKYYSRAFSASELLEFMIEVVRSRETHGT